MVFLIINNLIFSFTLYMLALIMMPISNEGLSLSSRPKSKFMINPVIPEATSLQEW